MHFLRPSRTARTQALPESTCSQGSDAKPQGEGPQEVRVEIAEFLHQHKPLIRRRLRRKLSSGSRLFDSEDLFSTIARRIDQEVERKRIVTLDEKHLWHLINRIAENYVADLARAERPRRKAFQAIYARGEGGPPERLNVDDARRQLHDLAGSVSGPEDRQLLVLRLLGAPFAAIADVLGITEQTTRQRWARLVRRLREHMVRDDR